MAAEQLLQLRHAQSGPAADVARQLVCTLRHSTTLIDWAYKQAALHAGIPLADIAPWADMSPDALTGLLTDSPEDSG